MKSRAKGPSRLKAKVKGLDAEGEEPEEPGATHEEALEAARSLIDEKYSDIELPPPENIHLIPGRGNYRRFNHIYINPDDFKSYGRGQQPINEHNSELFLRVLIEEGLHGNRKVFSKGWWSDMVPTNLNTPLNDLHEALEADAKRRAAETNAEFLERIGD
jgi:hypothetical protein